MSEAERLLEHYVTAVHFPEASAFEVLELLDVRSKLAAREHELTEAQKVRLEEADSFFLRHAETFHASLSALGDMPDIRRRAAAPRSHWWWYLEQLVQPAKVVAG